MKDKPRWEVPMDKYPFNRAMSAKFWFCNGEMDVYVCMGRNSGAVYPWRTYSQIDSKGTVYSYVDNALKV